MNRRRFLALVGAAVPGLWLDGIGLIQLPRHMVVAISGQCSFCAKDAREVYGLAGTTTHPSRVCNECIDICLEILRDDLYVQKISAPLPPAQHFMGSEISDAFDFEVTGTVRNVRIPQTRAELEAFMESLRNLINQSETGRRRTKNYDLSCSFCDREQNEVKKLIAGPQTYICDYCIGDAAALINMHC